MRRLEKMVTDLSDPSDPSKSESIPVLVGTRPSWTAQTSLPSCVSTATSEIRLLMSKSSIPPPFDTETDSDPDPDLASPLTFSDAPRSRDPIRTQA